MANLCGDIIAAPAYWRKEFACWENFDCRSHIITLLKEAATALASINRHQPVTERSEHGSQDDAEPPTAVTNASETAAALNSMTDLVSQLKAENKHLKARIAEVENAFHTTMWRRAMEQLSKDDYDKLVRCLHPDCWSHLNDTALTGALTQASQILNRLYEPVKEETQRKRRRAATRRRAS